MKRNLFSEESSARNGILEDNGEVAEFSAATNPDFADASEAALSEGVRRLPLVALGKKVYDDYFDNPDEPVLSPEVLNAKYNPPEKFTKAMSEYKAAKFIEESKQNLRNREILENYTGDSLVAKMAMMGAEFAPQIIDPINYVGGAIVSKGIGLVGRLAPEFAATVAQNTARSAALKILAEGAENTVGNIAIDAAVTNPVLKERGMERETEGYIEGNIIAGFGFAGLKEAVLKPLAKTLFNAKFYDPNIYAKVDYLIQKQVNQDLKVDFSDTIRYAYDSAKLGETKAGSRAYFLQYGDTKVSLDKTDLDGYIKDSNSITSYNAPEFISKNGSALPLSRVLSPEREFKISDEQKEFYKTILPRATDEEINSYINNKKADEIQRLVKSSDTVKEIYGKGRKTPQDLTLEEMEAAQDLLPFFNTEISPHDRNLLDFSADDARTYGDIFPVMEKDGKLLTLKDIADDIEEQRFKEFAHKKVSEFHPELKDIRPENIKVLSGPKELSALRDPGDKVPPIDTTAAIQKHNSPSASLYHDPELQAHLEDPEFMAMPTDEALNKSLTDLYDRIDNNPLVDETTKAEIAKIKSSPAAYDLVFKAAQYCVGLARKK